MSELNKTAIRKHALECSNKTRSGRFTRVGEDFLTEVESDVEALVREISNKYPTILYPEVPTAETFVTGPWLNRLRVALDRAIARLIQNKVGKQPSVGTTLGRTR